MSSALFSDEAQYQPGNNCRCCNIFLYKHCRDPDGKSKIEPLRSWITLMATFMLNILIASTDTGFSIFYDHLIVKFNTHRSTIGLIFSVFLAVGSSIGLAASPFVVLYGCRPVAFAGSVIITVGIVLIAYVSSIIGLIVSYGIIAGMGLGCIYLTVNTAPQQCFTHNRGLATGIASLGMTTGTILCPVLVEYFLENYSISGALLLYGAIFLQGAVFATLMKSPKHMIRSRNRSNRRNAKKPSDSKDVNTTVTVNENLLVENSHSEEPFQEKEECEIDGIVENTNSEKSSSLSKDQPEEPKNIRDEMKILFKSMIDFSVLKEITFVIAVFFYILFFFTRFALFSNIVSAAIHQGINPRDAAYLMSIIGLCNLVVRIISSILMNFKWLNPLLYTCIGFLLLASAAFVASQAQNYEMFVVCMVLVGCSEGVAFTIYPLVAHYILGVERFARGFSVLMVGSMLGIFPATPVTGVLIEKTGEYTISFLLAGITGTLSACLAFVAYFIKRKQSNTTQHTLETSS